MSRIAIAVAATLVLAGIYTTVQACGDETRVETVEHTVTTTETAVITVGSVDIQLPKHLLDEKGLKEMNQCYVFTTTVTTDEPAGKASKVISAAKKARTLGRALVTTVEAVMGAITHAAVEKTAASV